MWTQIYCNKNKLITKMQRGTKKRILTKKHLSRIWDHMAHSFQIFIVSNKLKNKVLMESTYMFLD
jgi:hypothetical protein